MRIKLHCLCIMLVMFAGIHQAAAQGTTAFTYQGQLRDGGTNANGAYTMIFKLYDAFTNGNQIGAAITNNPGLLNGLFTVTLDFGAGVFAGNPRWLDITITNGPTTETLWPRVQVLPSPYAQFAAIAATVTNGAIMNAQLAVNAVNSTNIQSGAITAGKIAAGAVANSNLTANAVATTNIQNNAITSLQIADGAVTNRDLSANAVNATNIATGQVVKSLNGFTDFVNISLIGIVTAGANTVLFPLGTNIQVSALVPNMQVFTNSGTFTVPTNVTRIKVEMWGGGGGGGRGSSLYDGGGGGAGGYAFNVFNVATGAGYPVTVGTGGTNGVSGTSSSFGALMVAAGGGAGTNATSNAAGGGGIGGTNNGVLFSFVSNGYAGTGYTSGNGGSALGEFGGPGGSGVASGVGANASGPGGGGSGGKAGQSNYAGGNGGPGLVVVYY